MEIILKSQTGFESLYIFKGSWRLAFKMFPLIIWVCEESIYRPI